MRQESVISCVGMVNSNMKTTVLMDSFKGCLSSEEAGMAVKTGIEASGIDAEVSVFPFADGGEGTLDAFLKADKKSKRVKVSVSDPLGRKIDAYYGVLSDNTVVIEIAQAAGLCLLSDDERNPMITTTKGVGQLLKHAIKRGYRKYIIALGGSATNDCGIGMLHELGLRLLNSKGKPVSAGALGMSETFYVCDEKLMPELKDCKVIIACDVDNPLYGPKGASYVFAPQKGASPADVECMDLWMKNLAGIFKTRYPDAHPKAKGAGAAGGLGFAIQTFLNGKMLPGAEVLLSRTGIEAKIASSDLVITGEGSIDAQTAMGKAPARIAALAKKYDKHVIALAGCVKEGSDACHDAGIDKIYRITPDSMTLEEAMKPEVAIENIKRTACKAIGEILTEGC